MKKKTTKTTKPTSRSKKVNNDYIFSVIQLERLITAREEESFLNERYINNWKLFDKTGSRYIFISRDNE